MPYVIRDSKKKVTGIFLTEHPEDIDGVPEQLSIDHPEIINFLSQAGENDQAKNLLGEYDTVLPRVLEDLIDILIRNRVVSFKQFPEPAQKTLSEREYLRELIRQSSREESKHKAQDKVKDKKH